MKTETQPSALPPSVRTKRQEQTFGPRFITFNGEAVKVLATVRYDDRCGNGHNTFSITGQYARADEPWGRGSSGCVHEAIQAAFPELAPLIKWHLVSSDGPLHYVANTVYHATQHGPDSAHVYHEDRANGIDRRCVKYCGIEEAQKICRTAGYSMEVDPKTAKEANLEHARSSAVWPEATQAQLLDKSALMERLPALMQEFKAAVESLGFTY